MDDDPPKQGAVNWRAQGVGVDEALPTLVPALGIEQVIITIADAPQVRLRRILSIYERITVRARAQMIPAMYDLCPSSGLAGRRTIRRAIPRFGPTLSDRPATLRGHGC